jgi:hypothetical protein
MEQELGIILSVQGKTKLNFAEDKLVFQKARMTISQNSNSFPPKFLTEVI